MPLQQVLNLVRCEAERQAQLGTHLQFTEATPEVARQLIEKMAVLANMASTCKVEALETIAEFASRCQSYRHLQKHCGCCGEYDKANRCPVCDEVTS